MTIENLPNPETPKERAINNTNIKEHAGSATWANNTVPVFLTNLLTVFIHSTSQTKTEPQDEMSKLLDNRRFCLQFYFSYRNNYAGEKPKCSE